MSDGAGSDPFRKVGFVGLGRMGRPMAHLLAAEGLQVHGHDADPDVLAASAADGVVPVASIGELARTCPVVILMLPNSDVVDAVTAQLCSDGFPDPVVRRHVIDMGSSDPERTRRLATALGRADVEFWDAPVSGGVAAARSGSLTIMVGGTSEQYQFASSLLNPVGSTITHVGPVGSGHALKALNNLMSACSLVITTEALTVATRFDIDPATALAVINTSSGRSGSTEAKFPKFVLPGTFDSGFTAALMDKDIGIANRLANDVSVEVPLAEAVGRRWHELTAALGDAADHTEIVKPLEARYDIEIRARKNG